MAKGELGKLGRFRANEQSLDLAEQIAASVGQDFDREAVRELAEALHQAMFDDILGVLDLGVTPPQLHAGIFGYPRAFSAKTTSGENAVAIDMVFDFWALFSAIIVCVTTFTAPDEDERRLLAKDIQTLFELFLARRDYLTVRRDLAHYLLNPKYKGQTLSMAFAMARAMIVFILCHELAHVTLGHHEKEEDDDSSLEFEADALAAEYFLKVVEHGKITNQTYIHVFPPLACAPLVLTMVFELYETWLESVGLGAAMPNTHPPAIERTKKLQDIMQRHLDDKADEIACGAKRAITDLHGWLRLKVRN